MVGVLTLPGTARGEGVALGAVGVATVVVFCENIELPIDSEVALGGGSGGGVWLMAPQAERTGSNVARDINIANESFWRKAFMIILIQE